MAYLIQEVRGTAAQNSDIARFLASFVRDGELEKPKEGDDDPLVWVQRFGWWWDSNPFCVEDSPRGFVLRDSNGSIVGFNGMIPFDYEIDGEVVPTLVTTTFFVREAHRSAVMGLLARQRVLARTFHMIDGSPSPEMRQLLGRLGYEKSAERYQYFFPLSALGGGLSRAVLRGFGLCFVLPELQHESGNYIATRPEEIESIPVLKDGKLRRRITVESLSWLASVGSDKRSFFGLCDPYGELIAYAIGIYKRRCGVNACLLMDYVDFQPETGGLGRLIRRVTTFRGESGIRPDTHVVSWSVLGPSGKPAAAGLRRESILHYQIPKDRAGCEKSCVPFEGDLPLL